MTLYAATIFVSAFLLFLVQPLIAKQILPWFGGSATVWTTCLVFFQLALLAGYAYSDLVVRRLDLKLQIRLHIALLGTSLLMLPIIPGAYWKPEGDENPSWLILGMLGTSIGLPYFLLATTSPLVQHWFARTNPGASPYRLFALSNVASMLALASYPFLLEPWVPARGQASAWSLAYALFAILCGAAALYSRRNSVTTISSIAGAAEPEATDEAPPTLARQTQWCLLAATGSLLLLAVSNHITQDIASIPLLWILPLAIYLLTFIVCFDNQRRYRRALILPSLAAGIGVMAWTLADPRLRHQLGLQIGVFCCGLFIACMFCHGELVRSKPAPRYLTRFYLMISLGGAVGSVLVGIVAPRVLPGYFELAFGLILCGGLQVWQARRDSPAFPIVGLIGTLTAVGCAIWGTVEFYDSAIVATRNFYGVLRVKEVAPGTAYHHRSLLHGTILHGTQYLAPELRSRPTTYFSRTSGIGRLLEMLRLRNGPLNMGMIGLGTGTLAIYGAQGDGFRIYEINPAVVLIAQRDFTFLKDSGATLEILLGDARLELEREPPQHFDVMAIDAFSSDAIPVHLITSEALAVYQRHVKPGGVIAFHVTNRYLDLVPVVAALAKAHALHVIHIRDAGDGVASPSDWMLLSGNAQLLGAPQLARYAKPIVPRPDWRLWTDDFNNLLQVLK